MNDKLLDLCKQLYQLHSAGGPLHLVLDDSNVEDEYIQYCIDNVDDYAETPEMKALSLQIAEIMLGMSEAQRLEFTERYEYGDSIW